MLIINKTPLPNGAYENSEILNGPVTIPEGWVKVPDSLEKEVWSCLPYLIPVFDGDLLVSVKKDSTKHEPIISGPNFTRQPTEIEQAQQAITDLELSIIEQGQQYTDLELMVIGGMTNA